MCVYGANSPPLGRNQAENYCDFTVLQVYNHTFFVSMSTNEELNTRLATLETAVAGIADALQKLTTPSQNENQANAGGAEANNDDQAAAAEASNQNDHSDSVSDAIGLPADIQKEFGNIRDTLNRVKLPARYKLNETSLGVSKKDKPTFSVIQKNSRYLETGLKLLQVAQTDPNCQQGDDVAQYLDQLHIILQAAVLYNQQEYQAIVVGSTFDQETTKYFRVMQKSEHCFSPQALGNLKLAAEIASVSANRQATYTSQYSRPPSSYRGRGRGRANYSDNNRGYSPFNQYSRGRPPHYPPHGNNYNNAGPNAE